MKKLLIAMTAAAVGTCAWADGEAPTLPELNENFNSDWANGAELEYMTAIPAGKTLWSYSANPIGEGEIKVVTQSEGDNALSLNTGSKKLNAKFAAGEVTIPAGRDTGLYFKSTVTFSDPSDTLPELGDTDKFALVVLDNIESVEEGSNTTNLWVIAGHETDGKRAYLLQPFANDDDDYNLTDRWFNTPKTIEVRAIQNVMATGNLAGFIVKVEDVICRVVKSYPIVGGVIDMSPSAAEGTTYLGYSVEEIDATYQKRYATDKTLIVSAASSSTLTSVDFQGQGVIDDVSLATTGSNFGSDAVVLTFAGYDATKIASITVAGKTVTGGAYTILGNEDKDADNKSTITVTVQEGYVLDMTGWTKNGLTYTYLYELPTKSAEISLNVFAPAAYVGNKAYESLAKALEEVTAGATIELAGNVMVENNTSFAISGDITIDLMGKTIASPAPETLAVFEVSDGTLTIKDGVGGGKVDGAIIGGEDAVYNLIGGSFKNVYPFTLLREGEDALTFDFPVATGFDLINDYYVIKAGSSYTESEKLVEGEMTEAATETLDAIAEAIGESAGDDEVATYIANAYGTDEDGKPIKVTVATLADAVNVAVSVKNNLPLMTSENAEFVAEAVAADDGNVAAFEFTLQDGSADKVLPLTVKAKLENIIKVCTDLNTWVNAKIEAEGVADADVKATVSNGKVKVQLKSKTGGKCFMKLKAE